MWPTVNHTVVDPLPVRAGTCQVLYFDHRGQGRCDRSTPDQWNRDRWADDVVESCAALGIVKPFVLGLSFERFAGSGHGVFRDEPDTFFDVLRSFITDHLPFD